MPFFILFVLIPLAEIMVFVMVSGKIGLGTALLFALFTAVLGGALVRFQGLHTLMSAQSSLQSGGLPTKELFDGLCIVAAGATLITPGFITDILGFALLVPALRDILRRKLAGSGKFQSASFNTEFHDNQQQQRPNDPDIIDVDFETLDDSTNNKNRS